MKQKVTALPFVVLLAIVALGFALAVVPALAQNAVAPTAPQATRSPAFAAPIQTETTRSASRANQSSYLEMVAFTATDTPRFFNLTPSRIITYGTPVIFLSGVICVPPSGPCPPQGEQVTITIDGIPQNAMIYDNNGDFSTGFDTHTIPASQTPYTIKYSYAGDGNFNSASDTSTTLTVNKATPVFSNLTPSQTIPYGTPSITLSGVICAPGGVCPPIGEQVAITIYQIQELVPIPDNNGDFSLPFPTGVIPVGTYAIMYGYAGDQDFNPATDTSTNLNVDKANTATTVSSSQNPSEFNQPVTFTATVLPQFPGPPLTGTVGFTDNGVTIPGCGGVPLDSNGQAQCTTANLTVGMHEIVASYSGDSNFFPSTSPPLTQTVTGVGALQFVPVLPPCRLVDTRNPNGPFGGPALQAKSARSFTIPDNQDCNIPSSAAAYSLNVTVVPHGSLGYLTVWPTGQQQPLVSTLNSYDGRVKANAAIVPASVSGAISFYVTDTTDMVLDIDGYFVPVSGSTLAFYPLAPCRVADTRNPNGPLGGPFLQGGVNRDFPVLDASACNIPGSAQAYSLNFTVVPHGKLGYLTVCPTPSDPSQNCPVVSTLNADQGKVTANAAIVPAGTGGAIRTFPSNDTDLIIDINGYFGPQGAGGLSLYPVVPCRVLDTRPPSGSGAFQFALTPPVDVLNSSCAPPSDSQAYVFNATVVPQGGLGYLTLWPDGLQQPVVSTLNAYDGVVSSNMAIVPAGTAGKVDAWAQPLHPSDPTDLTNLILDISGYFAP